jgi:Periplasmic glucan biosynthesis protein, MdoG
MPLSFSLWLSLQSSRHLYTPRNRLVFDSVADRAKKLAAESFRAPPPIPELLTTISYDEYRDIRFDTKRSLWRERGNFQVQFVHPGLAALGVFLAALQSAARPSGWGFSGSRKKAGHRGSSQAYKPS